MKDVVYPDRNRAIMAYFTLFRRVIVLLTIIITIALIYGGTISVKAASLKENPYVTFSPDGLAWTSNAGDTNWEWYDNGDIVTTGIPSQLRALKTGEHYYQYGRIGIVPVKEWLVAYKTAGCCHNSYPEGYYHGITYGTENCFSKYFSGWRAYCADCGDEVSKINIYMSKEAAASIGEIDMNLHYYYLQLFKNYTFIKKYVIM